MSDQLRRQRGAIKARLTTATDMAERISEDIQSTTREELEARIQKLEETYNKYQAISQQLMIAVPEEEYEQRDAVEDSEFEDRYFAVKATFMQGLEKLSPTSQASISSSTDQIGVGTLTQILTQQATIIQQLSEQASTASGNDVLARILEQQGQMLERFSISSGGPREVKVKLPTIPPPSFSGEIEEWKRFADTFKTLIHETELSNVQKHQYLVGSLSGAAAKVIESIEISDENYSVAWELLKKRYEDERAIRKRHVQCLFELPRVQRESAGAIQELVDHVHKHLRVLHSMKLPTESWGELIIYVIEKNLDSATRKCWEEHAETLEFATTDTMLDFLQRRCQVLERESLGKTSGKVSGKSKFNHHDKNDDNMRKQHLKPEGQTSLSITTQGRSCYFCKGQHCIYFCEQFLNLSVENRIQAVKRLKLCINCLRKNHFVANCKFSSCRECGGRHNSRCHLNKEPPNSMGNSGERATAIAEMVKNAEPSKRSEQGAEIISGGSSSGMSVHHVRRNVERKRVLMSTAIVNTKQSNEHNCQLRVLLDSASETNFVTFAACKKLGLNLDNVCESISGLSSMNCTVQHGCQLRLESRVSNFQLNPYCLVVPIITKDLPSFTIRVSQLSIPENLKLADPFFYSPGNIDVLLGGEFFFQLLENDRIELGNDLPILQNSKLGWIIAGSIPEHLIVNPPENHSFSLIDTNGIL